jgi:hypothetical protein
MPIAMPAAAHLQPDFQLKYFMREHPAIEGVMVAEAGAGSQSPATQAIMARSPRPRRATC